MLFLQDRGGRAPMLLALVAMVALAAVALNGVWPGQDDPDAEAEAAIAQTIDALFSDDPASCGLATENFLSAHFHPEEGQSALDACREEAEEDSSHSEQSVSIGLIEVAGSVASASFSVTGGSFDSAQMTVRMVDEAGWKIDVITAVEIDKARWLAAQREQIDQLPPREAALESCVIEWMGRNASAEEIGASVRSGNEEFVLGSLRACIAPARDAFIAGLRTSMAEQGASSAQIACMTYAIRAALSDADLRALFTAFVHQQAPSAQLAEKVRRAASGCGPVTSAGPPNV